MANGDLQNMKIAAGPSAHVLKGPVERRQRLFMAASSTFPGRPNQAPRVGTKTSAMTSDAVGVSTMVIGRYFMNSPTTPGQNISGVKAARSSPWKR